MINSSTTVIPTPSIEELFFKTDKYSGISLFSASTESDREITGLNPVIVLKENEIFLGKRRIAISDPLAELDEIIRSHPEIPDEAGFLGYIAYDFKDRLEEEGLYERRSQGIFPDFYFVLFEHYVISHRSRAESRLVSLDFPFDYERITYTPETPAVQAVMMEGKSYYRGTSLNKREFEGAVEKTVDYIKRGDIYQANITRAIYGETTFPPSRRPCGSTTPTGLPTACSPPSREAMW